MDSKLSTYTIYLTKNGYLVRKPYGMDGEVTLNEEMWTFESLESLLYWMKNHTEEPEIDLFAEMAKANIEPKIKSWWNKLRGK